MGIEYDEKGKIFTNVVTKRSIPILAQIPGQRVRGNLHVSPESRITDAMNAPDEFVAITDASILGETGEVQYRSKLLILNRASILWLIPEEEIQN